MWFVGAPEGMSAPLVGRGPGARRGSPGKRAGVGTRLQTSVALEPGVRRRVGRERMNEVVCPLALRAQR